MIMNQSKRLMGIFQKILPSPMSIAIILTFFIVLMAIFYKPAGVNYGARFIDVLGY